MTFNPELQIADYQYALELALRALSLYNGRELQCVVSKAGAVPGERVVVDCGEEADVTIGVIHSIISGNSAG